jgi:hypothetical protein
MSELSITLSIEGVTPLLCNKFTDAAAMAATNGTRAATVGNGRGEPKEQAEEKLYLSESEGKPVIPQPNLFRCFIDAGKFFKNGKSKVTTLKNSIIPSCLTLPQFEFAIVHKNPWEVDTRAVRIPSTGGRILAHRPCFHDWRLENIEMLLDGEIMSEKLLREIVDAAGKRIGLGDFRPDCKGPFGRFVVVNWEAEE